MTEQLFQFIWKQGLFDIHSLTTMEGHELKILEPGYWNHDQGPDFKVARIQINGLIWSGQVELHLRTSDWLRHGHDEDPNYRNVILHVVWQHDVALANGVPVLELRDRVKKILLDRYKNWMSQDRRIACENEWKSSGLRPSKAWWRKLVIRRLEKKAVEWRQQWLDLGHDWEELCWRKTAKSFGGTHNGDAFEHIAVSLPLRLLRKHRDQPHQLEALLLGQGGVLPQCSSDKYVHMLRREYDFLTAKYDLKPLHMPLVFFRLRPGSFPMLRLAQLSMLIHSHIHLFASLRDSVDLEEMKKMFKMTANDYWHYHYRLEEVSAFREKTVGSKMVDSILINMCIPLLYTYGKVMDDRRMIEKAVNWLERLPQEDNRVTRIFSGVDAGLENALCSQAVLELKHENCDKKKCLECNIGQLLIGRWDKRN